MACPVLNESECSNITSSLHLSRKFGREQKVCEVVPVHAGKVNRVVVVQVHSSSTSVLDTGEWSTWRPAAGKDAPGTQWIRGWEGPSATLDVLQFGNISCPYHESNYDSTDASPVSLLLYWLRFSSSAFTWHWFTCFKTGLSLLAVNATVMNVTFRRYRVRIPAEWRLYHDSVFRGFPPHYPQPQEGIT